MLRISNLRMPLDAEYRDVVMQCAAKLGVAVNRIRSAEISKKSIDARRKNDIHFIYSVDLCLSKEDESRFLRLKDVTETQAYTYKPAENRYASEYPPVVVGFGPAGMMAGLILAQAGLCPVIYERGSDVNRRLRKIDDLRIGGILDTETNIQFGEGGAGAFSDGKLTTGIKDARRGKVLEEFVEAGAPEEIKYLAKPHIGTDILPSVVANIRKEIIKAGGMVYFDSRVEDIEIRGGRLYSVVVKSGETVKTVRTGNLILAIGHSARDTFEMLYRRGVEMVQKPFSIGARIEHPQEMISRSQYGKMAYSPYLGAADYKLSVHLPGGRGVYTFCMCPGGAVIPSQSEENTIVTNGMSTYARDGINANSALLVGVDTADFGSGHPLAGIEMQRAIERAAFECGGGNYFAPCQLLGDFMRGKTSTCYGSVMATYRPGTTPSNLTRVLPEFVIGSMRKAVGLMAEKLKGFDMYDAVLTAPETRSSSPVRIPRRGNMQSNIDGIYPVGEGAGYAGGIMSAAVDGIKCAEYVISNG